MWLHWLLAFALTAGILTLGSAWLIEARHFTGSASANGRVEGGG